MSKKKWRYEKQYHCQECAATDENYSFRVFDPTKKLSVAKFHDEATARLMVDAINAYSPSSDDRTTPSTKEK